ncbi:unnamed protein product [Phyllotreta striolata]|uniref:Uncharacterized protein n=1 Tax=Phyllotreta striolata TaxID=444603 RepID=A0A9N9TG60_PHYSR|nr:unnamed protein product [Phyllotreta striolata]
MFYVKFVVLWLTCCGLKYSTGKHERSRRYVIYPRGGAFKIVIGIGTPVKLGTKQSMAIGWNLQMQYNVPTNVSQITNYPPVYTKKKRSDDRSDETTPASDRAMFYRALEEVLENQGMDGRICLLRTICENALYPLNHEANGLYGKVFHIILTPDYGDGEIDEDLDPVYLEAQSAGESGAKCSCLYAGCKLENGLLDIFSILDSPYG